MARWEPDAKGRLREAALELYAERGFERTTVADIAERAGLTARTFFNHFTDKRDVVFVGSQDLVDVLVHGLETAPPDVTPMTAVMAALDAAAAVIGTDRDRSRRRQEVILANRELAERELAKLATLGAALAEGLERRDVPKADAELAAETGITIFRIGFDRWTTGTEGEDLVHHLHAVRARLSRLTA